MSYTGHTHRGRRGGRRGHGNGAGGDFYYGGPPVPRLAADERVAALRESVAGTVAVARLVARDGSPEKAAKAADLLNQARKALFKLLAESE
jgi:hypothetical protein